MAFKVFTVLLATLSLMSASSMTALGIGVADSIPETKNQFYGHGAYMGAVRQMVADKKWNRILQVLMPDVYAELTKALSGSEASKKCILMVENNPVMAAYGVYRTRELDRQGAAGGRTDRIAKMKAVEWDVWLPTDAVRDFNNGISQARQKVATDFIIAHGNRLQTIAENTTAFRQYDNVRKTSKTDQGGVRPQAWMDLFGRALILADSADWQKLATDFGDATRHARYKNTEDQSSFQTFQTPLSFQIAIKKFKQCSGKATFSVVLDIKSRDASPKILRMLVEELNKKGVHVYGIGSFVHSEFQGLRDVAQTVDGQSFAGPKEIKFYHLAGDLQRACLDGKVKNDTVMFNVASLLKYNKFQLGAKKKASYEIDTKTAKQLADFKKKYGFHVGLYIQENDLDDRAARLVTEYANNNPDVVDVGFAWGGISGEVAADIEPSLMDATVGFGGQDIAGKMWDLSLSPAD